MIGKAIDEHYRKAFVNDNGDGDSSSSSKITNKKKKEEYDWKADRDLGKAIGEHYKYTAEAINEHYKQEFKMNDNNKSNSNSTDLYYYRR